MPAQFSLWRIRCNQKRRKQHKNSTDIAAEISRNISFVENTDGEEAEKQDCERKACYRLMERFKKEYTKLLACFCADSLYACENFLARCSSSGWHYILRYKEGSIPTAADEYGRLKKTEKNRREQELCDGSCRHDFVTDIDYNGHKVNIAECGEECGTALVKADRKTYAIRTGNPIIESSELDQREMLLYLRQRNDMIKI